MPAVSVIIAAYRAHAFLGEALQSVLAQSFSDFEVVIAPDEFTDYSGFAGRDNRIRVLPGVVQPAGPGAARNRALAEASGEWIALLDADDLWSENYLATLLPLAQAHDGSGAGADRQLGAAYGRTSVEQDGVELRSVPPIGSPFVAQWSSFKNAYASFHGVTRRLGPTEPRVWRNIFAEDVLFDVETLALAGGSAPYAEEAVYYLRLRNDSATRETTFVQGIDAHYAEICSAILQGRTQVAERHRSSAAQVFESWRRMNDRFQIAQAAIPGLTYQNYIVGITR